VLDLLRVLCREGDFVGVWDCYVFIFYDCCK
jgi:hypothetical protein